MEGPLDRPTPVVEAPALETPNLSPRDSELHTINLKFADKVGPRKADMMASFAIVIDTIARTVAAAGHGELQHPIARMVAHKSISDVLQDLLYTQVSLLYPDDVTAGKEFVSTFWDFQAEFLATIRKYEDDGKTLRRVAANDSAETRAESEGGVIAVETN